MNGLGLSLFDKMNGIDNQRHIVLNLRAQLFPTTVNSQNRKKTYKIQCELPANIGRLVCICKCTVGVQRGLGSVCAAGWVPCQPVARALKPT